MDKHFKQNKISDSAMKLHASDGSYRKTDVIDFAITLIIVFVAVFAFRAFIFEPVKVSGVSMTNTLLDGERMFVEKFTYWLDSPSRGDIVICHFPPTYKPSNPDETYVKRVVGLPGETIKVENGSVWIKAVGASDFVRLHEDYIKDGDGHIHYEMDEVVIPDDCIFVMGDNRNNSTDSHVPVVGPIKLTYIVGRVHGVVYPFSNMRELKGVNYAQ